VSPRDTRFDDTVGSDDAVRSDGAVGSDDAVRSDPSTAAASRSVAPLPPVRGAGLAHVIIPGTALWFVALVVLLFMLPTLRAHDAMLWMWTALAGWLLGFVGLAIYGWQRAAARRGSRGASRSALDEQIGGTRRRA
jgi:hypothetical protein